jgi:nitroreductase
VVVRDELVRRQVSIVARRSWEGARSIAEVAIDPVMFNEVDRFIEDRDFGGAPVLVVLGVDLHRVSEAVAACSIYPAAQNLMLAALALGYASAFTNFTVRANEALSEVVGFPDHVVPYGIISLGVAAKSLGPPRRESVSDKAHSDRYGQHWH